MDKPPKPNLIDEFSRYFEIKIADTEALRQQVYGIRYRVYCKEFGYEDESHFPCDVEHDEFDDIAIHALIIHKESQLPAACVRLVPALGDIDTHPLPIEKYCSHGLNEDIIESLSINRHTLCEISRLAVDTQFRLRDKESASPLGDVEFEPNKPFAFSDPEFRTFPLLSVACFFAAIALTGLTKRTQVFAMMEAFLPRMLKRSGIYFQKVGNAINYHGTRAPHFITTQTAIDGIQCDLDFVHLYEWIYASLSVQLKPQA